MKILSIETCGPICAVAILDDYKLIKEISLNNGLTHSETLMPIIKEIFEKTNLTLTNIDLLAVDIGPGSFTGIRIGVATAKAFIDSLNINSVGVSSLQALSLNVKQNGIVCPLIDARKQNVYSSIFENSNGNYIEKFKPSFEHIDSLISKLKTLNTDNLIFVGDGAEKNKNVILNAFPNAVFESNNDLSAINVGIAGFNNYKNGKYSFIEPLYIRKSEAEIKLEEKQNGAN